MSPASACRLRRCRRRPIRSTSPAIGALQRVPRRRQRKSLFRNALDRCEQLMLTLPITAGSPSRAAATPEACWPKQPGRGKNVAKLAARSLTVSKFARSGPQRHWSRLSCWSGHCDGRGGGPAGVGLVRCSENVALFVPACIFYRRPVLVLWCIERFLERGDLCDVG